MTVVHHLARAVAELLRLGFVAAQAVVEATAVPSRVPVEWVAEWELDT